MFGTREPRSAYAMTAAAETRKAGSGKAGAAAAGAGCIGVGDCKAAFIQPVLVVERGALEELR